MNQPTLYQAIEAFKSNLKEFLISGLYTVTEELAEESKAIMNGLDKLKLEDMFVSTTKRTPNPFNRKEISHDQRGFKI